MLHSLHEYDMYSLKKNDFINFINAYCVHCAGMFVLFWLLLYSGFEIWNSLVL